MLAKLFLLLVVTLMACHEVSSYHFSREQVLKPFQEGKAFKVIAGLNNFNPSLVQKVAIAADQGGATHVDIACDAKLVAMVKALCKNTAVCVSSIKPKEFVKAVEAGADMIEIGNFDGFYEAGLRFSARDVLELTRETRSLLPSTPLSVTVPHTLPLPEQILLAKELERLSVDIIQTEGKMGVDPASMGVQELIEKAAPALASAYALSRAVKIPVMCSSGLSDVTAPMALSAGARGVGVGSVINRLKEEQQMLLAVSAIAHAIGLAPTTHDDSDVSDISLHRSTVSTSSPEPRLLQRGVTNANSADVRQQQ